jgi:glycosyltransferase involved in cell wall biosynthesis
MGGQERRVLAESVGMRDRGHDVSIVTPEDGDLASRAREAGLDVIPMPFRRSWLPANARSLASLVRRLQPNVVNSHSSADSWTAALARRMGPRPGALVRSRHISARVKPGPLHRFLYGQADYVVTTGESVRRDLAESGLFPLDRSISIPTGVDLDRFRPDPGRRAEMRRVLEITAEGPVLGVVAYLREDKGHAILLQAMPEILRNCPDCSLVVVGDGPQREHLEALARHLQIEAAVRFVGLREDVASVLCAFDVFCLPSVRNEGVPQSILQASAAGLPVVSTAVGGIPEAVVHGVTGLVVSPGDSGALARAIGGLIADPELRHRLGNAGGEHVSASFSVQRMLDLTERAYAAAVGFAISRGGTVPLSLPGT